MATCSVARIFTNPIIVLEIFGCARHNSNKFGSALTCAKIRVISATEQVAIFEMLCYSCKFVRFVGK